MHCRDQTKGLIVRPGPRRHERDLTWLQERVHIDPSTQCWVWRHTKNHKGYGRYKHTTDDGVKTSSAHRLALELRLGRPLSPGLQALHRCDNPACCNADHIFEGTAAANLLDCRTKGRMVFVRGEDCGAAKLLAEDIPKIRALLASGHSQRAIARRFGVDQAQISRIKTGKTWADH